MAKKLKLAKTRKFTVKDDGYEYDVHVDFGLGEYEPYTCISHERTSAEQRFSFTVPKVVVDAATVKLLIYVYDFGVDAGRKRGRNQIRSELTELLTQETI